MFHCFKQFSFAFFLSRLVALFDWRPGKANPCKANPIGLVIVESLKTVA